MAYVLVTGFGNVLARSWSTNWAKNTKLVFAKSSGGFLFFSFHPRAYEIWLLITLGLGNGPPVALLTLNRFTPSKQGRTQWGKTIYKWLFSVSYTCLLKCGFLRKSFIMNASLSVEHLVFTFWLVQHRKPTKKGWLRCSTHKGCIHNKWLLKKSIL